jgi:hypothetical protein
LHSHIRSTCAFYVLVQNIPYLNRGFLRLHKSRIIALKNTTIWLLNF